jgi:hypothetical protein
LIHDEDGSLTAAQIEHPSIVVKEPQCMGVRGDSQGGDSRGEAYYEKRGRIFPP